MVRVFFDETCVELQRLRETTEAVRNFCLKEQRLRFGGEVVKGVSVCVSMDGIMLSGYRIQPINTIPLRGIYVGLRYYPLSGMHIWRFPVSHPPISGALLIPF